MIKLTCPNCNETIYVYGVDTYEDAIGATIDCSYCGTTLLIEHNKAVVDLWDKIEKENNITIDRSQTGYIEV